MRDDVGRHMETGNVDEAMRIFFDYWQESGAWNLLSAEARTRLVERAAKVPQDFAALMGDPMELRQMRRLTMATLILRGEKAPPATRLLAERIARAIPKGRVLDIAGAGHMGPLTHRDIVAERMAGHVRRVAGVEPADLYVAA
jgi:pimeloyl-ACP methyl ester carboxylesterase